MKLKQLFLELLEVSCARNAGESDSDFITRCGNSAWIPYFSGNMYDPKAREKETNEPPHETPLDKSAERSHYGSNEDEDDEVERSNDFDTGYYPKRISKKDWEYGRKGKNATFGTDDGRDDNTEQQQNATASSKTKPIRKEGYPIVQRGVATKGADDNTIVMKDRGGDNEMGLLGGDIDYKRTDKKDTNDMMSTTKGDELDKWMEKKTEEILNKFKETRMRGLSEDDLNRPSPKLRPEPHPTRHETEHPSYEKDAFGKKKNPYNPPKK